MYTYKITNTVSGPFWVVNSVESSLRAFCNFYDLSIDIFTSASGLISKDMSFVIRGKCEKKWQAETRGKEAIAKIRRLLEQYGGLI